MKPIVAIIPARGGSKRIPDKNIALLLDKPLMAYTIEVALEAGVAERVIVTTDSDRIAQVAVDYGAEVVHRPANISHDTASTESALLHTLDVLAQDGFQPASVLTLPPTSPLRSAQTICAFSAAYELVLDRYDAMISVHENRGDFWIRTAENEFRRLFPDAPRRTQDREPLYEENSTLYLTDVQALRETGSILGHQATAFVINSIEGIDINTPGDMLWVEFLLRTQAANQAQDPK